MKPPIGMVPLAGSKKGGYYDPATGQTRYDQKAKYNKVTAKGVAETQKDANDGESTSDPGNPGERPRKAPRGHRREVRHLEQTHRVEIGHYVYTKHSRQGHVGWVEHLMGRPTGKILSSVEVLGFFHRAEGDPHQEELDEIVRRHHEANSRRDEELEKLFGGVAKAARRKPPHQPDTSGRTEEQLEQAPVVAIGPIEYHRHKSDGVVSWVGYHHGIRTGKVHNSRWVLDHWNWAHAHGGKA